MKERRAVCGVSLVAQRAEGWNSFRNDGLPCSVCFLQRGKSCMALLVKVGWKGMNSKAGDGEKWVLLCPTNHKSFICCIIKCHSPPEWCRGLSESQVPFWPWVSSPSLCRIRQFLCLFSAKPHSASLLSQLCCQSPQELLKDSFAKSASLASQWCVLWDFFAAFLFWSLFSQMYSLHILSLALRNSSASTTSNCTFWNHCILFVCPWIVWNHKCNTIQYKSKWNITF